MLALASLSLVSSASAQFADAVVSYNSGTGFQSGYTNPNAVLGQPSTSDSYGYAVDPLDPPWQNTQLVSIGAGGELTLHVSTAITHDAGHPYGLDFTLFGNSFFVGTAPDYTTTDGTVYSSAHTAKISVSADGVNFYTLDPNRAPQVNVWFPTDGAGDFTLPVNPALTGTDFAGLDLNGIRSLYQGSAGGTSYSLSLAEDAQGNPVNLSSADYVRIDGLTGDTFIAGLAVVPEPSTCALGLLGALTVWRRARRS